MNLLETFDSITSTGQTNLNINCFLFQIWIKQIFN